MLTSKPASNSSQQTHIARPPVPYMAMGRPGASDNKIVYKSSPFYKDIQVLSPARLCIGKEPGTFFYEKQESADAECERGTSFYVRDETSATATTIS